MANLSKFLIAISFFFVAPTAQSQDSARSPLMIIHLLDYLAKDYAGAVDDYGKVRSQGEYDEQIEFAKIVEETGKAAPALKDNAEINKTISSLKILIEQKGLPSEVSKLAREAQAAVMAAAKIEVSPTDWPSISEGQKLYHASCVACHGSGGGGDGPAGAGLDPKPANFLDQDAMKGLSPFQAFNTIRLGVPGTGMTSFPHLSDHEVWSLSFYILSLRHQKESNEKLSSLPIELNVLASKSDQKILEILNGTDQEKLRTISLLRTYEPKPSRGEAYLATMATLLDDSVSQYANGEQEKAESLAVRAYLEGFEPLEPRVRANDPDAVVRIEEKMANYRASMKRSDSVESLQSQVSSIKEDLAQITNLISQKAISPSVAFSGAFFILLREGFEAVLVILTLLSVIKAFGSPVASRWVHGGWIAALLVGVLTWFGIGGLLDMSGAGRETMEAIVSVVAVVVLLYFGFWLHRQSEIGRWKLFIEENVKGALESKNLLGLATISFFAVFREALETVLFLKAIWFDADQPARQALTFGVGIALALIFVLSYFALKYSKRVPVRQLFTISSVMMCGLSFVLAGKAVHAFQEAGYVDVTTLPLKFTVDLLGVYSTLETTSAQIATLLIVAGLWWYGAQPSLAAEEVKIRS